MASNCKKTGSASWKQHFLPDHLAAGAIWLAVSLFTLFGTFEKFDLWLTDSIGAIAERAPGSADVVVVAIDQQSFVEIALPWPWPRSHYAELLSAARRSGARGVVFDIVFDARTDEDAAFAEAISSFGPVILASERLVLQTPQGSIESLAVPAPILSSAAHAIGEAELPLDADGRMRRIPSNQNSLAQVSALMFGAAAGSDHAAPPHVRFRRDAASLPVVSYVQALHAETRLPPETLKDKILIIGLALPANPTVTSFVGDEINLPAYASPTTNGRTPGVVGQAQALSTLLANDTLKRAPLWSERLLFLGLALLSAVCAFTTERNLRLCVILACGGLVGLLVMQIILRRMGVVLMGAPALTGLTLSSILIITLTGLRNHKARLRLVRGFSKYVAPDILTTILESPAPPDLGGVKRTISVIVTDLESYTSLMDGLPTETGADLLRQYLDRLGDIVLQHGGMIDQFIGDSVVAIFNAPLEQSDHAVRAVRCAIALEQAGLTFQADMALAGHSVGVTRVGADCGAAVIGNFGARDRFHYTAIGDVMNIASRLETANKITGTRLLISQPLVDAAGAQEELRLMGEIDLKGVSKPICAFSTHTPQ